MDDDDAGSGRSEKILAIAGLAAGVVLILVSADLLRSAREEEPDEPGPDS
jgi:hypothetical protein